MYTSLYECRYSAHTYMQIMMVNFSIQVQARIQSSSYSISHDPELLRKLAVLSCKFSAEFLRSCFKINTSICVNFKYLRIDSKTKNSMQLHLLILKFMQITEIHILQNVNKLTMSVNFHLVYTWKINVSLNTIHLQQVQ